MMLRIIQERLLLRNRHLIRHLAKTSFNLQYSTSSVCHACLAKKITTVGHLVTVRPFRTSSARFSEQNEDDKDKDKKRQEEKDKWMKLTLFLTGPLALLLLWDLLGGGRSNSAADKEDATAVGHIKWKDFVHELLAKGEVAELIVHPEANVVVVVVHPGAVLRGQEPSPHPRIFRMEVPSIQWFEENLRKVEESLGIPPGKEVLSYPEIAKLFFRSYLLLYTLVGLGVYLVLRYGRGQSKFRIMNFPNILDSVRKAKFRIVDPSVPSEIPKVKFADVVGLHEAKIEVKEFVDYLKVPDTYTRLGAKLPKGALLLGPPGCGKTLLAKAVSSEANVPFLNMNGTEFVEMIGGLGAARVRDLFKEAKRRAPCIIYIDEIDAVGRSRGGERSFARSSHSEEEHTLNQLLVEMDGMESNKGVVILASTNRPDILDKALLRRGRFDRHINIDLPTLKERTEIFEYYLKKIVLEKTPAAYAHGMAELTPGFTGADIANVCNEAAIRAATAQRVHVTDQDISEALDRVLTGSQKRSTTISPKEKEIVAYHESGHALVGWLLKYTDALLKVTIVPRTVAALGFAQYNPQDRKIYSEEELFDRMCMVLGGRVAENITFKSVTTGAQDDLSKVTRVAYDQIRNYGMNAKVGPLSFAPLPNSDEYIFRKPYSKMLHALIDREANALVMKAYNATDKLLKENRDKLELLAKKLLEKETLTYDDVKALLGPPKYGEKRVTQMVDFELPSPVESAEDSAPEGPSGKTEKGIENREND